MKITHRSWTLIAVTALSAAMFFVTTHDAFAHGNFEFKAGGNVNNTVRIVLGETKEPRFAGGEHNLEMTITDKFTNLRVGNAFRSQASSPTTVLFADTFFYPRGTTPSVTGCVAASPNPGGCQAGAGYTDSRLGQSIVAISVNDGGSAGQYRQALRQHYTEDGVTLYHVYGRINYFNDTGIGLIPVNIWTDGQGIKRISVCESKGTAQHTACMNGDTTYNKTMTLNGGFGALANMTTQYWPGANAGVTEQTHPTNLRKAIGEIREDGWDIFNFLRDIAGGINGLIQNFSPGAGANVTIPAAKP